MTNKRKKLLLAGSLLIAAFLAWTMLVQIVDVSPIGPNKTDVGFATFNCWFHRLTGVHMPLYTITDWLGLVPVGICMIFAGTGAVQLIKRRSLFWVDRDLLFLGVYYAAVIFFYLIFEMIPINYRPILIEGRLEASYPSSTTLLVLSVMPTLTEQASRRIQSTAVRSIIRIFTVCFCTFMVLGRLISGVHWLTDIVGSVFLSSGLFFLYHSAVLLRANNRE